MAAVGDLVVVGGTKEVPIEASYLGEFDDRSWYVDFTSGKSYWRVPELRETIAAPEGRRIVAADFSQIEVKIMAYLSQDPILIEAINSGWDTHCYVAFRVFGKKLGFTYDDIYAATQSLNAKQHPRHKELKTLRGNIKTTVFGSAYGAGPRTISEQTGMSIDEAKAFLEAFFAEFVVLKAWLDKQGNFALRNGYTATPDGRKRFYILPNHSDVDYDEKIAQIRRWASNHPIQAASADMLKRALSYIYKAIRGGSNTGMKLYDAAIILVVHDEIVIECAAEDAEAIKAIVKEGMQRAYDDIIKPNVPKESDDIRVTADGMIYVNNKIDVVIDQIWEKV